MVNLADVENGLPYSEDELDKPIKDITLGNAVKIRPMHFDYNRGTLARFGAGVVRGFESLEDIPEQVELFGDEISYGLGGYFGDDEKEINRKRSNIDTAIRNLEEIRKERDRYSSAKEQESLAFGVGEGVPSYAIALAGGYVGGSLAKLAGAAEKGITASATAAGLASMAPQQFGSEVQQRLPRTETGEIDYEKITPKWALKVNGGALVATAVNLVLEKKLGFGEQMKVWRTPIKFGKFTPTNVARGLTKGGVTAASEGTTESLQDLSSYGISLVDGSATIADFPEQMQQALKSGIIGGILGGTVGTAVAIREGYNFRKQLRDMVAPVVQNVETAEKIADEVYNSANDTMTNIISKELELDSQLKAKRGDVYNSMVKAISKAMDKSGGYTGLTEEQKAQHATEVANMFADQALAEANKRGVLITDVVDAKDIVYQDGGIRFAPKTTVKKPRQYHPERMNLLTYLKYKGGLKDVGGDLKSMDAGKQVIGLINNKYGRSLDDAALDAWENGYFTGQERPTVNDLLNAIDESLKGKKIYRESFKPVVEKKQAKEQEAINEDMLNQYLSDFLSQEELDSMSLEDKQRFYDDYQEQANATTEDDYIQQEIDSLNEAESERYSIMLENGSTHDEAMEQIRAMRQSPELEEWFDLYQENEKLDAENPAYEEETININGVEKTVYNSEGQRIAKSAEALQNFYKWFGDSKVVDEQGRPLVVYHGTRQRGITEFKTPYADKLIFFAYKKEFADDWAKNAPLTKEQTQLYRDMPYFSIEVSKKYREKYGENWAENESLMQEARAERENLEKEYLRNAGIEEITMPVYLKAENTFKPAEHWDLVIDEIEKYYGKDYRDENADAQTKEYLKQIKDGKWIFFEHENVIKKIRELGFDSIELEEISGQGITTIAVFEGNNQIKSTSNRGTYSESDNIYYQSAFHGSPYPELEGGHFSLEKVGSGEGAAAHGYGVLYAAKVRDVAEYYRETLAEPDISYEYDGDAKLTNAEIRIIGQYGLNKAIQMAERQLDLKIAQGYSESDIEEQKAIVEKLKSVNEKDIKKIVKENKGQVHEVDIPENPYLLDEQKPFSEQSDIVKKGIIDTINSMNLTEKQKEKFRNNIENRRDTGKEIYEELVVAMGTSRGDGLISSSKENMPLVSKALSENGVKGITYFGRQDGRCFVIFSPDDVKVIQKFYQGEKIKRGSYNENSKVIKLFKDANTSTLPHELAHYWLDNMYSYVKSGAASVDYLNQFQAVKDFLGIKDNQEFLTRQQQEKFASGYEKYIHRGIIPNSIMGNVYAGYERWLRDVYDSIEDIKAQGKLPFKLTPEIIKFFDSMLTGGLGEVATTEVADIARLEETQEADNEVTKEAKEVIDAKPIKQTTELLPVKSEGEVKESRLYERMKDLGDAEDSLGYNEVTIAEQREKAQKMWQENPEQAQSILDDVNFSNDILRNALFTEQQARALENGDTDTYLSSLRQQSAEATRMGQELSALRGVLEDITMPAYWIREAEMEAHKQLAKKMTSYIDRLRGKSSLESLTRQLDEDIDSLTQKMLSSDDKVKTLKEGINDLKKKYKGLEQRDVELFQEEFTNEAEAKKYVEKKAKEAIGLNLTDEQANNIIQMASNLDKMSDKFDKFGVPSEKYFAEKAKLEKAVNEHTPTSQVKVLISTIGRANMLTAPATSVLNVVSNLENYAIQKSLRYINNNITNNTNDNIVDSELAKEYRAKLWQTFWNTGYDVSIMRSLTDTKLYKGESITHSEGDGAIRQIGRFAEKYVFSRLISSPDIYFKSIKGFTDYVGNEATDIAYKEGLTGEKAKNRANDLFLDATRIEPQTEEGKLIRQKAQVEAAVITYQQDTELSKNLLKLRELINKGTGDIGIGDILSPFVKTPANILSMGYDATVGAFGHPKNLIQAINDLRSGNLQSDALQTTIRQTTNQVLSGVLIAVILSALIDDDDYIPDYSQLSQSERNAIREAGGTFGSVKIGNTYISTDFFGPLEMPLVAWLNARREKGLLGKASAFGGAVIREFLDAPVIRDTISSSKSLENIGAGHLELEEALYDYLGDTISSRLTPNVLNILAKITDDYERKAGKSITDKLKARIPYLRQELPAQVSMATGRPVETQPAWLQILFGARAKEERNSPLAKEFRRLSQTGNGASISDPTKYGDLRTLPDELKIKVLKDFSEQYSKEANKTIKLASYKKAGDEEKKNMLDKVRRKTTKDIKQKYKKYLKKNKQ